MLRSLGRLFTRSQDQLDLALESAPRNATELLARLKALGLTDRSLMRVCQVGEPCIVQVKTTRIGLSRVVADGILVVPEPVS